jgi:CRISPR-associated endonuclease Csn1
MAPYTLGLDIGSNSIGWALLSNNAGRGIINLGVRVFPEGVDRDTGGLEKSKNATRREARSARRTHQRRNLRKQQLLNVLEKAGLLPENESELRSLFHISPYQLRKKSLDEKLEPYEFGRVLYHIGQRRGFKSNRKTGKAKEDGIVTKEAGKLQADIDASNCRTIGEYFAGLNPEEQRIRGKYTFRSMYEKEYDLLWAKQAEFYPDVLTEQLRKKIRDEIIFFQRPLKPADDLIGKCGLEPDEKRCPRGDWYARQFRLLQDVNNLEIRNPNGIEAKLTDQQRRIVLGELAEKKEVTFDSLRKKLELMETQRFNLEQDGKVKNLKGDAFVAAMRSRNIFGPKCWDAMEEVEKIKLNEWLVELEDDQLSEKLRSKYGLSDEQIGHILKIALPRGYASFSRKAIMKLLPFMEAGAITSEAIEKAGYRPDEGDAGEALERLLQPPDLRNPIVQKALFEVRKVVNTIVREHGNPAKVKIEMARNVHGSMRQREELHWKIRENEKRNEDARKRLREDIRIANPTRDDVIKYKLWIECDKVCPYTGRSISQEALFGANPEFQVEHILPYDRSLDDSFMNKTLCEVHENIHVKRNQTPYEAYGHDAKRFEQILERVNKSQMPYHPKRKKFWQKEINLDEGIKRELNDTRYICRETVKYLKQLGVYVRGTRGKITAELRHQWGLDGIFTELGVRRDDDHRRHAVDAVVVAVTENEHLRRLARSKYSVTGVVFEQPWPDFRQEVKEKVKHINVSHRVQRKVSGKLHEETNYGATDKEGLYVFRKKLEDLTLPMVEKIVDPVVRRIVEGRLTERGIDLAGSGKPPKEVWKELLYMKTTRSNKQVPIKKVRVYNVAEKVIAMKDRSGRPYRYVEPGSNHHIEIFEFTDAKGRTKRDGLVITMFDAVQRSQKDEPVVKRDYGDGKKFICSLAINEMVMMEQDGGVNELYRVQKINQNTQIFFQPHIYGGDLKNHPPISKMPNQLRGYKVTVDPLGRIWPAND